MLVARTSHGHCRRLCAIIAINSPDTVRTKYSSIKMAGLLHKLLPPLLLTKRCLKQKFKRF